MIRVGLIGPGRLGRTLAAALPRDRYSLDWICSSSWVSARRATRELRAGAPLRDWAELEAADCIVVTVPPDYSPRVLSRLLSDVELAGKVILHTGVAASAETAELETAGAHPACVFPISYLDKPQVNLGGACCAVSGSPPAVKLARRLVTHCGGTPITVEADAMAEVEAARALLVEPLTALAHLAALPGRASRSGRKK